MRTAVYLVTNTLDGKQYVGSSNDPFGRWVTHQQSAYYQHRCTLPLPRAIRRDGREAFRFEVLSWHDTQEEARAVEGATIERLGTYYPAGYNFNSPLGERVRSPEELRARRAFEVEVAADLDAEFRRTMMRAIG
jgi:hypothetical protein